uniref:Auxin efflux carrier component n=1 Tax=Leersia perrieri TaxID=77586 RepID=A0A0D9V4Y1_9ORYZ
MVSWTDIYLVLEATVPLYVAMILAYLSIKWWKLFTPEQCSGINKYVAKFSIPLLSFQVISTTNPYDMNIKLIYSDILQKSLALLGFAAISKVCCAEKFDWLVTGFSLSTLPNTLIVGIPLLKGMYGEQAVKLLSQIVVLQSLIWYTLLLFLFELRSAKGRGTTTSSETTAESDTRGPTQQRYEEVQAKGVSARCSVAFRFLLLVGKKLVMNPNIYACMIGLIWALISFRWHVQLPLVVSNSIRLLSDGGLGMAMFSLGLFTALQTKIIACGAKKMLLSLAIRFFLGPILMGASSYVIGMRGVLLKIAIVQAALPQGIVSFVFAKEYNVHADILSTAIIIGMMIAVPVALAYYFAMIIPDFNKH